MTDSSSEAISASMEICHKILTAVDLTNYYYRLFYVMAHGNNKKINSKWNQFRAPNINLMGIKIVVTDRNVWHNGKIGILAKRKGQPERMMFL